MQLTKVFAILSLAACSLAAPTVEMVQKRTDANSCAQAQGTLKCCEQKPTLQTISSLGLNTPTLSSLLGAIPILLPLLVPTAITSQCFSLLDQSCSAVNVCCITPSSYNNLSPQGQANLIPILSNNNILSNNQIAFCPSIPL